MGIMDTLASVSTPETESGGIAASIAQAAMQYEVCANWQEMATKKFGCLAFQIVESFSHLLAEEQSDVTADSSTAAT